MVRLSHPSPVTFGTHNSSLEGAMTLKLGPFCSSRDALSDGILFC